MYFIAQCLGNVTVFFIFFNYKLTCFTCGRRQPRSELLNSHWSIWRCSPKRASRDPKSDSEEDTRRSDQGSSATPGRQSSPTSTWPVQALLHLMWRINTDTHLARQQDRVLIQTQHRIGFYGNMWQEPTGGLREQTAAVNLQSARRLLFIWRALFCEMRRMSRR